MVSLDNIPSIINSETESFDLEKPFTFVEFVKLFEHNKENDASFFEAFNVYLHRWGEIKNENFQGDIESFVQKQLFELLKTITLSYSSYEEQRYLANIDLNDPEQVKSVIPIYSKRILDICNFYRKKRQDVGNIIRRNSFKGSIQSIEEIVYNKIVDWAFGNKNIPLAYKEIKKNLTVSIENYVDTYSEYFDIPRDETVQDKTRYNYDMMTSNMNTVDYRYFVSVSEVVAGMIYQGSVYLKEIPLIATLALDLGQQCVGDLLAMKNSLSYHATINRIDLDEQIVIKRDLYKKFIGCDLYYAYMDQDGNVMSDILCKADNPTGNLLNCCSADAAVQPSNQLTELNKIGLFFKPDKCSILKVNARDYTWEFDTDNMTEGSWYIFPDPNKYGDIGTNKSSEYPLIMTYKDTYDIRNLSSGEARDYPLAFVGDQNWRAYYSKSDDEFIQFDNTNFDYQFTKRILRQEMVCNKPSLPQPIKNVQMDMFGNLFGVWSLRTDFGTQKVLLYYYDKTTEGMDANTCIMRVKILLSKEAQTLKNTSILISFTDNPDETINTSNQSFVTKDFEMLFGKEYTISIRMFNGDISLIFQNGLDTFSETVIRKNPSVSSSTEVSEVEPTFYKTSVSSIVSFSDVDDMTKERYINTQPTYLFVKEKETIGTAFTQDEFENEEWEYNTTYRFQTYALFEHICYDADYTSTFVDVSDNKEGVLVRNNIVAIGNMFEMRKDAIVSFDYNMTIDMLESGIHDTDDQTTIDGKYTKENGEIVYRKQENIETKNQ